MRTRKPAKYHEFTELPAWTRPVWKGDGVANDADPYKWSGTKNDPPAIGAKVTTYNGYGTGTVLTYFAEYGWLGVKLALDNPPAWYVRQNNGNPAAHFFGIDLEKRRSIVTKKQ